jgi:SHS2 domain-containing protein
MKLAMPFEYLDHEADIVIVGSGCSLNEAFREASRGLFNLMADLNGIHPSMSIPIYREASSIPDLFVGFLNELLFRRDVEELLFNDVTLQIEKIEETYHLNGTAFGEPIDPERHALHMEVKAATYAAFSCEEQDGVWTIQCVVDV